MYDLRQAPQVWFHRLSTYLITFGFTRSKTDIFTLLQGHILLDHLHPHLLDDILITGADTTVIDALIKFFMAEFAAQDMGPIHFFLGVELTPHPNGCFLFQHKYVWDILRRAHMEDAKPVSTLMVVDVSLSNSSHPLDDPT